MPEKLERIRLICKALNISNTFNLSLFAKSRIPTGFRFFPVTNIGFCQVYKSGLTSWNYYSYQLLANRTQYLPVYGKDLFTLMKSYYKRIYNLPPAVSSGANFSSFIKVLFLRHPFERLVSFYEQRILNNKLPERQRPIEMFNRFKVAGSVGRKTDSFKHSRQ